MHPAFARMGQQFKSSLWHTVEYRKPPETAWTERQGFYQPDSLRAVQDDGYNTVYTRQHVLSVLKADYPLLAAGDQFRLGGRVYRAKAWESDGIDTLDIFLE